MGGDVGVAAFSTKQRFISIAGTQKQNTVPR